MGLADDSREYEHFTENDPRIGSTYSQLRVDLDEQARRIALAIGLNEEALGIAADMVELQIHGSYSLQDTLQKMRQVLETGRVE